MKSYILILIIFFSFFFSCSDHDESNANICSVENPIEDLDWLKSKIADLQQTSSEILKYFYVSRAEYQNKTVFIFANCCPLCNTVLPVYSCSGELIGILGTRENDIDFNILNNDIIVWEPSDFACSE